jgi:hypothetical protein
MVNNWFGVATEEMGEPEIPIFLLQIGNELV